MSYTIRKFTHTTVQYKDGWFIVHGHYLVADDDQKIALGSYTSMSEVRKYYPDATVENALLEKA